MKKFKCDYCGKYIIGKKNQKIIGTINGAYWQSERKCKNCFLNSFVLPINEMRKVFSDNDIIKEVRKEIEI